MASKDVLPLYRRLLKTKAALLAVSFTLVGILLIMLNAWLATLSLGDWSWLHHLPLDEVGGPLLGAGLVSTVLDYSYQRDQELRLPLGSKSAVREVEIKFMQNVGWQSMPQILTLSDLRLVAVRPTSTTP